MAKQLNLDEMLEAAIQIDATRADAFRRALEAVGDSMAQFIGQSLNVRHGRAIFEGTGFAGTCCPFYPATPGQDCPEVLAAYDEMEWDDDAPEEMPDNYCETARFIRR